MSEIVFFLEEASAQAMLEGFRPFDKPDALASPARKLQSIAPAYQKVGGSRAIGPHLDPANKRSHSFGVFVEGLRTLAAS